MSEENVSETTKVINDDKGGTVVRRVFLALLIIIVTFASITLVSNIIQNNSDSVQRQCLHGATVASPDGSTASC